MKIIYICESISGNSSGGRVVRYMAEIMKNKGHNIKIIVLDNRYKNYQSDEFISKNEVIFLRINKLMRMVGLFIAIPQIKIFENEIKKNKPDVIHIASFENKKSSGFLRIAKRYGIKIILQPWTMHFYCAQGFGYYSQKNTICTECIDRGFISGIKKGCIKIGGILDQIERIRVKKESKLADFVLSSHTEMDQILKKYGTDAEKIKRFPVPFDYLKFIKGIQNNTNKKTSSQKIYSIYYGQFNQHKGADILIKAYKKINKSVIWVFPMEFIGRKYKNMEIFNGVNWRNGLIENIRDAIFVHIPSLWSSTTEYSLCEAVFMKKPVVLFNVGIHRDIFQNEQDAMVVDCNDVDKYITAINKLEDDAALRKNIADAAYIKLSEIHKEETVYKNLIGIYLS